MGLRKILCQCLRELLRFLYVSVQERLKRKASNSPDEAAPTPKRLALPGAAAASQPAKESERKAEYPDKTTPASTSAVLPAAAAASRVKGSEGLPAPLSGRKRKTPVKSTPHRQAASNRRRSATPRKTYKAIGVKEVGILLCSLM